jgi:hypothetical protein
MVQATSDTDNTKENTGSIARESKDKNKDDEKEGTYSKRPRPTKRTSRKKQLLLPRTRTRTSRKQQ